MRLHQQQGQLRDIGGQQQHHNNDANERPDPLDDPLERDVGHGGAHEQVDAVGRGDEADGQVHGHDDAEVDGVDAQRHRHGQQDGSQDGAAGDVVHKHTHHQQEHVHQQQDDDLVVADAQNEGG